MKEINLYRETFYFTKMKKFLQDLFAEKKQETFHQTQQQNQRSYNYQPLSYPFNSYSYVPRDSRELPQPVYQGNPPKGSCNAGPQFMAGGLIQQPGRIL